MSGVLEAIAIGALLAGGLTLWVGIGYFVQAKILKSPTPGQHAIVTSMILTMIAFAAAAIFSGRW